MKKTFTIEGTLTALAEGSCGRVCALCCEGALRRRLQDLGLVDGTLVQCVRRSANGGPIAFLIRGAVIALRVEDCGRVMIK